MSTASMIFRLPAGVTDWLEDEADSRQCSPLTIVLTALALYRADGNAASSLAMEAQRPASVAATLAGSEVVAKPAAPRSRQRRQRHRRTR